MANYLSSDASFSIDDDTGSLTDISSYVNSVTDAGGNALVEDTGLGDARRTEQLDVDPVQVMNVNGFMNTTTEPIIGAWLEGTSQLKTVDFSPDGSQHYPGEAIVGPVEVSAPIGLMTFSLELHSSDVTGFTRTSVAAS